MWRCISRWGLQSPREDCWVVRERWSFRGTCEASLSLSHTSSLSLVLSLSLTLSLSLSLSAPFTSLAHSLACSLSLSLTHSLSLSLSLSAPFTSLAHSLACSLSLSYSLSLSLSLLPSSLLLILSLVLSLSLLLTLSLSLLPSPQSQSCRSVIEWRCHGSPSVVPNNRRYLFIFHSPWVTDIFLFSICSRLLASIRSGLHWVAVTHGETPNDSFVAGCLCLQTEEKIAIWEKGI